VEHSVRDDEQPASLEPSPHGRHQLVEQLVQVRLCSPEDGLLESPDVIGSHPKLRELKLQQAYLLADARHDRNWRDLNRAGIDETEKDAIVDLEVLDEHRALGQSV